MIQAQMDFTRGSFQSSTWLDWCRELCLLSYSRHGTLSCKDGAVGSAQGFARNFKGEHRIRPLLVASGSIERSCPERFPKVSSRFVTPEVLVETWENGEIISNIMEDSVMMSFSSRNLGRLFGSWTCRIPAVGQYVKGF